MRFIIYSLSALLLTANVNASDAKNYLADLPPLRTIENPDQQLQSVLTLIPGDVRQKIVGYLDDNDAVAYGSCCKLARRDLHNTIVNFFNNFQRVEFGEFWKSQTALARAVQWGADAPVSPRAVASIPFGPMLSRLAIMWTLRKDPCRDYGYVWLASALLEKYPEHARILHKEIGEGAPQDFGTAEDPFPGCLNNKNSYQKRLMAAKLLALRGDEKGKAVLLKFVEQLSAIPEGGDREVIFSSYVDQILQAQNKQKPVWVCYMDDLLILNHYCSILLQASESEYNYDILADAGVLRNYLSKHFPTNMSFLLHVLRCVETLHASVNGDIETMLQREGEMISETDPADFFQVINLHTAFAWRNYGKYETLLKKPFPQILKDISSQTWRYKQVIKIFYDCVDEIVGLLLKPNKEDVLVYLQDQLTYLKWCLASTILCYQDTKRFDVAEQYIDEILAAFPADNIWNFGFGDENWTQIQGIRRGWLFEQKAILALHKKDYVALEAHLTEVPYCRQGLFLALKKHVNDELPEGVLKAVGGAIARTVGDAEKEKEETDHDIYGNKSYLNLFKVTFDDEFIHKYLREQPEVIEKIREIIQRD